MIKFIRLWARREGAALNQLAYGKSASKRFRGLRRSNRNEAKLLLLAILPSLLLAPFVPKWSDASIFQKVLMVSAGSWAAAVVLVGLGFMFRVFLQTLNPNNA